MSIIKVENLSKKYIIGHDKAADKAYHYYSLRESLMHHTRGIYQRLRHPLTPNRENTELEEFWALKDINFEIEQGDRVGIIGRNGAGKSTLLKILSRITEPTSGKITMKGRVASLLEVGTGFHPELSGRENIYLNGAVLGMTRVEIKKKFDEIVAFAEIEKFLDTPVKRYSSGMYVRLAFAVAAHLEPEILLVDEVLAVGDAEFQKKCLGKMEDVSKEGRTVLFVSHNMAAINKLCMKTILLNYGAIRHIGDSVSTYEIYNRDNKDEQTNEKFNKEGILKNIKNLRVKEVFEPIMGHILSLEIELGDHPDNIGVDIVLSNEHKVRFAFVASAYYDYIKITKKTKHIRCIIGPINLAVGKYSLSINIVDPTKLLYEENPDILSFQIKNNISVNPYNFQLNASTGLVVVPHQHWEIVN
ncbi:MAG: ABC transporter ATP-binding protein [Victivallaceae bacterium]|nr:ABC transporter ATP-binding protein [Victivallaceae bacterium]